MTTHELSHRRPTLIDAQAAVRRFLQESLPDVHRVDVIKVTATGSAESAWEAEAIVWQPNATIHALGLSMRRLVLEQAFYVVRLDNQLDVIGYEIREAENAR
jgi:hypothetical protein